MCFGTPRVDLAGITFSHGENCTGEFEFFNAYTDGRAGWQPKGLFGNSPLEISRALVQVYGCVLEGRCPICTQGQNPLLWGKLVQVERHSYRRMHAEPPKGSYFLPTADSSGGRNGQLCGSAQAAEPA
jgi:hypothetical protein